MNALTRYLRTVASCPPSGTGNRLVHRWVLATAHWALRSGIGFETWRRDVAAHATRPVSAIEFSEAWTRASGTRPGREAPTSRIEIRPAPLTVQDLIAKGAGATVQDLMAASPAKICDDANGATEAQLHLQALFRPDELVGCGDWRATQDNCGRLVRWIEWLVLPRDAWIARWRQGFPLPTLLSINPLKPEGGRRKRDGKVVAVCDDAVAVYRHALLEWDHLPLEQQIELLVGRGLDDVSSIVHSGHHSLHATVRVDISDAAAWKTEIKDGLFARVLVPLGADPSCDSPWHPSRLAGAWRDPSRESKWDNKAAAEVPPAARQKLYFARKEL